MRQLIIKVPSESAEKVLAVAKELEGKNIVQTDAREGVLLFIHLDNNRIDEFLLNTQDVPDIEINYNPNGTIILSRPIGKIAQGLQRVTLKSSFEIYVRGLQSIGSYKVLVGYAIVAGIIAWLGLFTSSIILLVASTIIAPFAGPAMNTALATSYGDTHLLKRASIRYFVSIAISVAVSFFLSWLFDFNRPNALISSISRVSRIAMLIPVVAGAAGALNLIQAQRDSLVSGAAVGVVVAATLSPPAAILGMTLASGNTQMIGSASFLLLLQFFGIHLGAALVFRYFGQLKDKLIALINGKAKLFYINLGATLAALGIMLFVQFRDNPYLELKSVDSELIRFVDQASKRIAGVKLLQVQVSFPSPEWQQEETALTNIYLTRGKNTIPAQAIKDSVQTYVKKQIADKQLNIMPVFSFNILDEEDY